MKASGSARSRPPTGPSWRPAWDYLRPGDTLVVSSLDRLSGSLADLMGIGAWLTMERPRAIAS